jgi:6-phosphogluconolactonase
MEEAQVRFFADIEEMSLAAAKQFMLWAQAAVAANGRFLVALSGGSTPRRLFSLLSQPPFADSIPWAQTHVLWGDERLVSPDDAGSNYKQAYDLLLQHVPIPAAQSHRAQGELDPAAAVRDYGRQLQALAEPGRAWPRLDLAIMGMGSDGHTASLFPGPIPPEETTQPVMAVTADYDGRPAQRLSLTPLVFNDAHHILFLVSGAEKAEALTAVLNHTDTPEQWPAQRIQPHEGQIMWFVAEITLSQTRN